MIDYISMDDFDRDYLSIKKIKDKLQSGTSIRYVDGAFLKKLLVDSGIFSDDYFEEVIKSNFFSSLVKHGGLREDKNNKKYTRANKKVRDDLKAKNDEAPNNLVNIFESVFNDVIIEELSAAAHSDPYSYRDGLFNRLLDLVKPSNTYYIELYNDIEYSLTDDPDLAKALSLLCLIAIFQDEIYELFPDKYRTHWSKDGFFPFQPEIKPLPDEVEDEVQGDPIPLTTNELFEAALSNTTELGKIAAVDMCFHGGTLWRTDGTKDRLLKKAISTGTKIRVIVNTTARVQEICSHMKQPDLEYVGFEKNLENWVKLMLKYPESVEIHIATVPLLRRSYIIRGEKSKGWANITYYSYGHVIDECQRVNYRSGCQEYKLYFDEFEYIWNNASEVYSETLLTISKPKRNDGFNESDEDNIAFVRKALENQECQAFDIISVLAYYCAIGRVRELIKSRLSDDSNFVLRMILPDPKNGENLEKWFLGFDKETMAIFKTFESWAKRYPDRFLLHYTDLPIADRMYINKTEKKMLVEHLSIPRSTNQALQEEYNKTTTPQIYDAFEDQFERIWTEFSYSFK